MYTTVVYQVKSKDVKAAAHAIAIGQSIGNPTIRNGYENNDHAAEISYVHNEEVVIKYKNKNLNRPTDVAQLLCTIQGGHTDIDIIDECRIRDIFVDIPEYKKIWHHPTDRPLVGGIIKPKSGITVSQLTEIIERMCDGGIDWIKEDEILSDPAYLPLSVRAEAVAKVLDKYRNVMYCMCVNGDPVHFLRQRKHAEDHGLGIHTNFWSGLGIYENPSVYQHFQRSGIRILTDERNPFSISWKVITTLAIMQGVDSIHAGMIGGYYPGDEQEVFDSLYLCRDHNRIATLSCGMNPDTAKSIKDRIGNNWLAAVGGWLHEGDITENVRKMRKAVES